jgi:hypothetical protein
MRSYSIFWFLLVFSGVSCLLHSCSSSGDHIHKPSDILLIHEGRQQEVIRDDLLQCQTIAFFRGMFAGNSDLLKDFFLNPIG